VLGRQTDDHITSTASFSNTLISHTEDEKMVTYDALGRPVELTMLGGGTALNDIYNVYDGLGNLIKQYQPDDGRALPGGSLRSGIPVVQYTFETNFTNNYSRQTQVIYPDTPGDLLFIRVRHLPPQPRSDVRCLPGHLEQRNQPDRLRRRKVQR
jgi:YD repeat-containing protein